LLGIYIFIYFREGSAEYVWDHYEDSVPMSSYLVAFAVTDFGHVVGDSTGNNVTMQLWARKNALDQIDYAQDVGPKLLKFYEEFFDVPYPLPKQDMIAIPQGRGAMENWGLITYPEYSMSYKEGVSSKKIKQSVAKIVSHEIAHQWFGDLVTPEWWTDLWLNEGFATYISFIGVEAIQPSMKLLEQFVLTMQNALELDALESSHQISIVVNHPDEISEIFDEITYNKGGAIIQMMDYFLTRDTFRKGLTAYFKDL
jgi:aminopeptidase N